MLNVWEYEVYGVTHRGAMQGYSDHGGTDVTYRFHRLDANGAVIRYPNGGRLLDCLSGAPLKAARRIGNMAEPS